jgi:hypothetical protein
VPRGTWASIGDRRSRWPPTPRPSCGMRSASAMPAIARACFTRAAATAQVLVVGRGFDQGRQRSSLKARHHSPRGWASAGWPTFQVVPSAALRTSSSGRRLAFLEGGRRRDRRLLEGGRRAGTQQQGRQQRGHAPCNHRFHYGFLPSAVASWSMHPGAGCRAHRPDASGSKRLARVRSRT